MRYFRQNRTLMLTQTAYIQYLLSTPTNYTGTHLAAHLPDASHDQVNRFSRNIHLAFK